MLWRKMMKCREVVDLLSDYIEGNLSDTEIAAIRKHLEGCANCKTFFDSLKTTVRLTKRIEPEEVPSDVVDRLQSFLKQRIRKP